MAALISKLDSFLWGWPLIILLFGTHIFMTIRTGFIQKDIFKAIKLSVTRDPEAVSRVYITVKGHGFLYNMVRIIAGTLIDVGRGKLAKDEDVRRMSIETYEGFDESACSDETYVRKLSEVYSG